jgi:predicted nuclease of predicted toxin-antitoxin system
MRFLVDESTGAAVVEYLRRSGHDVLAVAETMRQEEDPPILTLAFDEARILITNDKDFGELIFRTGKPITASCCSVFTMKVRPIACA